MRERIKKINWKFVFVMLVGNVILGLGIAIFKLSGLGNDPFSGMAMALAECVGIEYARFVILMNLGFFVIEIIWGRKLIGLGTIVNALLLGYIVTFFLQSDHIRDRCTTTDGDESIDCMYRSYHHKPWNFHVPASETGSCTI